MSAGYCADMAVAPPSEARPGAGDTVLVDFRKWGGGTHWQSRGVVLGGDQFGTWVGQPVGTHLERPGAAFDTRRAVVMLFPDAGFTPSFHDTSEPARVATYVDITTVPAWSRESGGAWRVTMIDLDLDVIQRVDGYTFVDDEDEFAQHQVELGYPSETIAAADREARAVFDAVLRRSGPFGPVSKDWLQQAVGLPPRTPA